MKIRPLQDINQPFQVGAYDLPGKLVVSESFSEGAQEEVALSELSRFRRGLHYVKIKGENLNEVHRVNIVK